MLTRASHPLPLLVVTADDELRALFAEMLTEEGYQAHVAASLEESLQRANEQAFALVLADLFVGRSPHDFTAARILRRRVHPTPMGLMTTHPLAPELAHQAGFAFVLPMPFELEDCLSQIAQALNHPLSQAQQAQAAILNSYFAAMLAQNWEGALALCMDDLAFYPPRLGMTRPARRLDGKTAALDYLQKAARRTTLLALTSLLIYSSPRGLVARWTGVWGLTNGSSLRRVSTTTFRFRGERISQVGLGDPLPGSNGQAARPHVS